MEMYHSHGIGCFIWELQETSYRRANGTSWTRTTGTSWWRITETLLGVSFETGLRRCGDVLMRRRHNAPLRRRHDILIRRRGDVPLRHLGDVPLRRCWVFHLRIPTTSLGRTERRRYDVATTSCYRVGQNLITRAKTISSTEDPLKQEIEHLKTAFCNIHDFPKNIVNNIIQEELLKSLKQHNIISDTEENCKNLQLIYHMLENKELNLQRKWKKNLKKALPDNVKTMVTYQKKVSK